MVPVSWALASADVNAGTARAARIAIIAITTSNSISVNAEKNFFVFFFIVGCFNCSCSEGILGSGGSPEPPRRLRSIAATKLVLRGFCYFSGCSGVVLKNFLLRLFFCGGFCLTLFWGFLVSDLGRVIAVSTDEVNIYF